MKKPPPDQLSLTLPEREPPPAPARAKRRRFRPPPETDRRVSPTRPPADAALLQSPVTASCGFCGHRLTVLGEAAICPSCGGIVARPDRDA